MWHVNARRISDRCAFRSIPTISSERRRRGRGWWPPSGCSCTAATSRAACLLRACVAQPKSGTRGVMIAAYRRRDPSRCACTPRQGRNNTCPEYRRIFACSGSLNKVRTRVGGTISAAEPYILAQCKIHQLGCSIWMYLRMGRKAMIFGQTQICEVQPDEDELSLRTATRTNAIDALP